ncbi:mitochondrial resolvase Ydc2 [Phyllosticta citricarpa]|uniref:Mitochondrial resolvase Ydc2 n=1 Tax=Phyllosticta paracitricarpa TaxID=2016321 RepID=A0ABR1NE44_9PEZI
MPPRAKLNVKPKTARSTIRASPDAAGAAPTPKATSTTPTSTTLKTIDLKTLLALFGSPTSGTKPTLISRLRHDVATPKLTPAVRRASGPAVQRIVSVDMGIRNLAFCVADVEIREASRQQSKSKSKDITPAGPEVSLSVVAWERIAVQELTAAEENDGAGEEGEGEGAAPEKESFLPSALSHIAYTLLTRALLPHAPGTLLIEQQRYRSQGSSAVQEWTYRVNMLEGMLWAVIKTLKAEEDKKAQARLASSSSSDGKSTSTADASSSVPLPSPHAVSPQRVANFWMTATPLGRALMAAKQPRRQSGRLKVEKRDKIAFLSAWLARSSGSDAVAIPSIVDAIMDEEGGASERDIGKLDDLADCLLQAAAWARWEGNRRTIEELMLKHDDGDEDALKRFAVACARGADEV